MKRTVEIEIEVADDVAYAGALIAVKAAVELGGSLRAIRFSRATPDVMDALRQQEPSADWAQYSGSVHKPR